MATTCPSGFEKKIVEMFHEQTSSKALSTFTCAVCGETSLSCSTQYKLPIADIEDLKMLKWKNIEPGTVISDETVTSPPLPFNEGSLKDVMLDPDGVIVDSASGVNGIQLLLCKQCFSTVKRKKNPALSLANSMYLGPVPSELKDLTPIERVIF